MIGTQARWSLPGGVLVLAVMLSISGATIANGSEGQSTDPALQAEWLQQHFRCEHATEMDAVATTDLALQAEWLQQHFRCDHATEMDAA